MPFRPAFDCLWCGKPWRSGGEGDLAGWASLCPDCLDRAQDNGFLRSRLRTALRERSGGSDPAALAPAPLAPAPPGHDMDAEMHAYYAARAPEYDDWYLRRGRYSRGPARDLAWHAELDAATTWLDGQPLSGALVELAAGTGWWSPLLADKGDLSLYDTSPETLDRARERLVAHGLRAHLHVRDAWAEPDREVDGVFCGFWLSHVRDERLGDFLALVARWLLPGGRFAFIDSLPDPESGAVDQDPVAVDGISRRRLADGREFRVVKVHRTADALADALRRAGFVDPAVTATTRFFVMGTAARPAWSADRTRPSTP